MAITSDITWTSGIEISLLATQYGVGSPWCQWRTPVNVYADNISVCVALCGYNWADNSDPRFSESTIGRRGTQ